MNTVDYYLVSIKVNSQVLKEAYLSNNPKSEGIKTETEEMISQEFEWLRDSGIQLLEITPIPDSDNHR